MFEIEGIVIRATPFRENDAVVNVLTNDRIISFLARGVLKFESKNAPTVNLFSKAKFQLSKGKEGFSLRSGELHTSFPHIKDNISSLAIADMIGEITNKFIQNDDAAKVYNWFSKALELLDEGFDPFTIGLIYFAVVLKETGYQLNVDSCVICGKTSQITAVSYLDGGFICKDCYMPSKHVQCDSRKLKIIRYIFKVDINNFKKVIFTKQECLELINDLKKFAYDNAQIDTKSINLLNKI